MLSVARLAGKPCVLRIRVADQALLCGNVFGVHAIDHETRIEFVKSRLIDGDGLC